MTQFPISADSMIRPFHSRAMAPASKGSASTRLAAPSNPPRHRAFSSRWNQGSQIDARHGSLEAGHADMVPAREGLEEQEQYSRQDVREDVPECKSNRKPGEPSPATSAATLIPAPAGSLGRSRRARAE